MARKIGTIKVSGGADYAKVADRLKAFREENPKAKILTESRSDGMRITFKAYIWRNKEELVELVKSGVEKDLLMMTADANGSAQKEFNNTEKNFEKLETVAVGRALALLGYATNGEVASSEEMEEFEDFKAQKQAEISEEFLVKMAKAKTLLELQKLFAEGVNKFKNNQEIVKRIIEVKDELKVKFKGEK